MSRDSVRTINSCCDTSGAAVNISFDPSVLADEMKKTLQKRLGKKGIGLQWTEQPDGAGLLVRVVEVDQGNQFLRWLLPFVSPAVVEVEGQIADGSSPPQAFHYIQKAHFGLFGGSPQGMLKACANRVADKIAGSVVKSLR